MSFLYALILTFSLHSFARAAENPVCDVCAKVDAIKNSSQSDSKKAARSLAELMSTLKFSDKKEIRAQEFESVLAAAGYLAEHDERREIPEYLADMEDESPEDFKAAFKKVPYSQQKELEPMIKAAHEMFEKGEEP